MNALLRTPAATTLRHILATWICALALGGLSGCGPGTGGTGIPPTEALGYFGATSANVCSAPFGASLCPSGTTTGSASDLTAGGLVANYADLQQGGNVTTELRAGGITLVARCQRLRFEGEWGIAATGEARFFGSYIIEPAGTYSPATLAVEAAPDRLSILLRDADGKVVLGPLALQPVAALPLQPAACP